MRFFGGVREGGTGICHVSLLVAAKAQSFFETFLLFFWSEFLDFYCINVHGIGVFGCPGGRGERLESLGRPSASLGNLLGMIPLILKVDGFGVPVVNFVWHSIKGHDSFHERSGDLWSMMLVQVVLL